MLFCYVQATSQKSNISNLKSTKLFEKAPFVHKSQLFNASTVSLNGKNNSTEVGRRNDNTRNLRTPGVRYEKIFFLKESKSRQYKHVANGNKKDLVRMFTPSRDLMTSSQKLLNKRGGVH